jgi:ribosome biogenesis GTPase
MKDFIECRIKENSIKGIKALINSGGDVVDYEIDETSGCHYETILQYPRKKNYIVRKSVNITSNAYYC